MNQNLPPIELHVVINNTKDRDVFFSQGEQKFTMCVLSSAYEEIYHVGNNPIPESISGWGNLIIIRDEVEGKCIFDMSLKWNGMTPKEIENLNEIKRRMQTALRLGRNLILNINSYFNPKEWAIYLG